MSRKRDSEQRQQRDLEVAVEYWLLRNDGQSPSEAYSTIGKSESTVKKACAEFSKHLFVWVIRSRKLTLPTYAEWLREQHARIEWDRAHVFVDLAAALAPLLNPRWSLFDAVPNK